MPWLVVLNGPPAIGKSTLARRYVDDHAGVLDLDIDQLAGLIGGERSPRLLALARSDALALAAAHLRAGADVLVPQYIGRVTELERFETVAAQSGADFRHLVLTADRALAVARFARRGRTTDDRLLQEIHREVESHGGSAAVAEMYDSLASVVRARPTSILLVSQEGAVDETYARLVAALSPG